MMNVMVKNDYFVFPTLVTYKVLGSHQFSSFLLAYAKSKEFIVLKAGL